MASSRRIALPPVRSRAVGTAGPAVLGIAALIGANTIWGGSPAASKAALDTFGPLTVGAGRAGIALLLLSLLLALRRERSVTGREPAILGLLGVSLFCALQNYGLYFADATTTTLINGARPVLIASLAVPLLGERMFSVRITGMLVSMAGIAALVIVGSGGSPEVTLGGLLPLGSALAIALYAVLARRTSGGVSSLALIAGATRYGFLFLLPGAILELATSDAPSPRGEDLLVMLYLGVGCSAISFLLLGYGLSRLDAGRGAAFFNIQVVAGVALSVTLLGESLPLARLAGGLLVVTGVAISSLTTDRSQRPAAT